MSRVLIGYVQGLHGLRGDLKIKCKFEKPDRVFRVGQSIYLNEEEHTITACKFYKGFYLVTIDNIKNINLVEHYKGFDVFIDRDNLHLLDGEYLLDDLYGMKIVSSNREYGVVENILNNGVYDILEINYEKKYMIPLIDEYVTKVDLVNKVIYVDDVERLII